jgi:hypothetical protein
MGDMYSVMLRINDEVYSGCFALRSSVLVLLRQQWRFWSQLTASNKSCSFTFAAHRNSSADK